MTEFLQRRQARIRDRIKETLEEVKKQQQVEQETDEPNETESSITITTAITTTEVPVEPEHITTIDDEDDDIMVIDWTRGDHQIQSIVGLIVAGEFDRLIYFSIRVIFMYIIFERNKRNMDEWCFQNWSHELFECKQISSSRAWSHSMWA